MTIIDAITSSPINVFFTIFIGIGLAYLFYRKPSSSGSTSSASITSPATHHLSRAFSPAFRSPSGLDAGVDEELQRALAQIESQERDMIRQEQDEAYQKSLKADKEKKLKREQEMRDKENREREEKERAEQAERLHQALTKLKSEISSKITNANPGPNDTDKVVKLVFKLPDGTRVKRDFYKTDKVKILYWFVFSLENAPLQFKMTTNFPKRDLPGRPPLPEDFEGPNSELDLPKRRNSTSSADSHNAVSSDVRFKESRLETSSVEPNCELTLEDIELTATQIIFVYDLEA